ncbi:tryptophan aminotransferase-related protein 3-like [Phragmites australis]|uniref:tryptophan aminotransferase-related protein 3-like n=1 Tax=Phragmites australis TaxID=29695 RepID=UPI002D78DEA0|nr:tryptophan aminotransferase-related protein 3-like [Phragmites australis]
MEAAGGTARRPAGLGLLVLLYSSLLLNVFFFAHHFVSPSHLLGAAGDCDCGLSWALQAAREAEAVAATDCSGHGHVFLDGIAAEDGRPGCECNHCFGGPDCSLRTPNCTADADSGDPLFLEPYWIRHAAAGAVVVSGWHRLSYRTTNGLFQSVELENQIRRLHRAVGNAVVDDKHLVFGAGSMQLINALVYALSPEANAASPPALVVATAPYYPAYRIQTAMFDGREYKWGGTTSVWANALRNSTGSLIEFVTSPNNPDALLHKPVLGASAAAIVDHAYYWPHFTHIPEPADEDVMMFTMSKPSGHAGSRLGWALIRDENVAKRAKEYVQSSIMGASRDTQLRMLGIVKVMLANLHGEEDIFTFGHNVMRARWRRLNAVVSRSRRISLQKIPPQYCTYFKRIREPSPAYAWVKCEREEDDDCSEALLKANIITRTGVSNEAGSRYTRISLLKSDDDFDVLMERVTDLVNAEKYEAPGSSSM